MSNLYPHMNIKDTICDTWEENKLQLDCKFLKPSSLNAAWESHIFWQNHLIKKKKMKP